MRAVLLGWCWLAVAGNGFAHRLDEYLQATRVAVATNRIDFTFELTPGVAVATQVLATIDLDRDGNISADEGTTYAHRFLNDLNIGLNGKTVSPSITSISFPAVQELRSGTAAIRIRATSTISPLPLGSHTLSLTNSHLPAISIYLVNVLRSANPAVEIGKQARDELQKEYHLEFRVRLIAP